MKMSANQSGRPGSRNVNRNRLLRWAAAGLLAVGLSCGAWNAAAAPAAQDLRLWDALSRGDKLLEQNQPAQAIGVMEPAFMAALDALDKGRKLQPDELAAVLVLSERLATAYERIGKFGDASVAFDFFMTVKQKVSPDKITARERARLQYLKDRAQGKPGTPPAPVTPAPAAPSSPAESTVAEQIGKLVELSRSKGPLPGIAPDPGSPTANLPGKAPGTLSILPRSQQRSTDGLMRFTLADEMFAKALSEAEASKDDDALQTALLDMGGHYNTTGDYARAEQLLLRAKPIADRKGPFAAGLVATSLTTTYASMGEYAKGPAGGRGSL